MIKAVLFDMDDTLLDIRFTTFITLYAADMSQLIGSISRKNPVTLGLPLVRSYLSMSDVNRTDELLNVDKFVQSFESFTGIPLLEPAIREALNYYECEILPHKNSRAINAHPMVGAHEILAHCRELNLPVALATNPAFSENCIKARLSWAELSFDDFCYVSHAENSYRLKPRPAYYEQVAAQLGLQPHECLMVGNDPTRDIVRPANGMPTAFVGGHRNKRAVWCGSLAQLNSELEELIGTLNDKDMRS